MAASFPTTPPSWCSATTRAMRVRMSALMRRARDPRLHARLDRPGRRRPDPPAGRAPGVAALHPQQRRLASVRCGRIGGGLARGDRTQGRPELPGVLAPEPAAPAAQRSAGRRHRTRRLRAGRCRRRHADVILIATGSEVGLAMQATGARWSEGIKMRVVSMPSTDVFDRQDAADTANRCCRKACASASRSKPASPISGASTSAWTAR